MKSDTFPHRWRGVMSVLHNGTMPASDHALGRARLIFLPKYPPDLDTIKQLFAKLKRRLSRAAKRSVEAVSAAIGGTPGTIRLFNLFENVVCMFEEGVKCDKIILAKMFAGGMQAESNGRVFVTRQIQDVR